MSKIDKIRVNNVDYDIVSGDNLPVGTEVDFDGQAADIPTGWEQVDDTPVYSTSETRCGTWINGKPVYRIVLSFSMSSGDYNLVHNLSIDELINIGGSILIGNDTTRNPFPHIQVLASNSVSACNIYQMVDSNTFKIRSTWDITDGKIIVEYTKTTDTGNGGNA